MVSNRFLHDSSMTQMLRVATGVLQDQGIICEITSPTSVSFSSTLPERRVKEIFEGSSPLMKPSFNSAENGCRGTAVVLGVLRADE